MFIGTIEFYQFKLLSTALTLAEGQWKVISVGFIFLHTFQLMKMNFETVLM